MFLPFGEYLQEYLINAIRTKANIKLKTLKDDDSLTGILFMTVLSGIVTLTKAYIIQLTYNYLARQYAAQYNIKDDKMFYLTYVESIVLTILIQIILN